MRHPEPREPQESRTYRWFVLGVMGCALCVGVSTLGTGCAPAVAVFRSAAPVGVPRPPSSVRVYMDEESAPARYEEIGMIVANTHVFIPVNFSLDTHLALAVQRRRGGNQRDTAVFRALVSKAARLGADAVIIKGFNKVDVNLTISAVAIRTPCVPVPAPPYVR